MAGRIFSDDEEEMDLSITDMDMNARIHGTLMMLRRGLYRHPLISAVTGDGRGEGEDEEEEDEEDDDGEEGGGTDTFPGNSAMITYLKRRGSIETKQVEEAFRLCPRVAFVPEAQRREAYSFHPLRLMLLGFNISAPEVYASALENLEIQVGQRFLDVGCGCGQLTAMGAVLVGNEGFALGLDLRDDIVEFARENISNLSSISEGFLSRAGSIRIEKANVFLFDPTDLLGEGGRLDRDADFRFDRIHCGATCPEGNLPDLLSLLRPGGRLVTPCGDVMLALTKKADDEIERRVVAQVRYGDLVIPSEKKIFQSRYKRSLRSRSVLPLIPVETGNSTCENRFLDSSSADVTVVFGSKASPPFLAHRDVLSRGSVYFKNLFGAGSCTEAKLPEEFSPETFLEILRFLYTGDADIHPGNNVEALEMAKFFDISPAFYRLCEISLLRNLTVDNAAETMITSARYCCPALKKSVALFILQNLPEVRQTPNFASMGNLLLCDILEEARELNTALVSFLDS